MNENQGCPGPSRIPGLSCGRAVKANGHCAGHAKQLDRGRTPGELTPLREGPPLVKLPGTALRVSAEAAGAVAGEAQARGVPVSLIVRELVERGALGAAPAPRHRKKRSA